MAPVYLFCRAGDHHLCPVFVDNEQCACACHTRDREERKAATG